MVVPENLRHISDNRFTADSELVDSLKVVVSDLSPAQELGVKNLGVAIEGSLYRLYGLYIPPYRQEELSGVSDRILVTNKTAFRRFMVGWPRHSQGSDATIGTVYREGSIIHLLNTRRIWGMMPKNFREEFSQRLSNFPDTARDIFANTLLVNNLAHEMAHVYQHPILPRVFAECGARYYSRAISQDLDALYMYLDLDEERIAFYEDLIERYGEVRVHKVFFGSEADYLRASEVLSGATDKINAILFPYG